VGGFAFTPFINQSNKCIFAGLYSLPYNYFKNQLMKKLSIPFILLVLASCSTTKEPLYPNWPPQQLRTFEEVKVIAAKYGLDTIISPEETALLVFTEQQLLEYFTDRKYEVDKEREYQAFMAERASVIRTYKDYFDLLDKYPKYKADYIRAEGGQLKYDEYVKEKLAIPNWIIYIEPNGHDGMLAFYHPDTKPEDLPKVGTRIDNLPRGVGQR
jgi:hypothetical protein